MDLLEAAKHCEKAWGQYAKKHNIHRYDEFYILKIQEELGELVRHFLELKGSELKTSEVGKLQEKFEGDCVSLIGNALILALHFKVDIEKILVKKFPVQAESK